MKKGKYKNSLDGKIYTFVGKSKIVGGTGEEFIIMQDKERNLFIWPERTFCSKIPNKSLSPVPTFVHLSDGLKYMRFMGLILNQKDIEEVEYECPTCNSRNWVLVEVRLNGRDDDFEAIKCWKCNGVHFISESKAERYCEFDIIQANTVDGIKNRSL